MSIRRIPYIARPLGLQYTHFPIAYLLEVGEKKKLNHMVYFDHILHIHMHVNIPQPLACKTTFLMDEGY